MLHYIQIGIILLNSFISTQNQKSNISLTVNNCLPNKGNILVALYSNEKGFPGNAKLSFKSFEGKVSENGICIMTLTDIPSGTYAISVFQDENKDGNLNTNFMGIPKEGYGFSNDAHKPFGPPDFKDCIFTHKGESKISVKLKKW